MQVRPENVERPIEDVSQPPDKWTHPAEAEQHETKRPEKPMPPTDIISDEAKDYVYKKYPILQYFKYAHLPEHLQTISKPFGDLAWSMCVSLAGSNNPAEVAEGLRKLLEAKDCFVRAALTK